MACAIAIAAAIDPAMSIAEAMRPRIALVTLDPSSPDANDVRASLARDLAADYDVVPHFASDAAAAIVIGARYPDEQVVDSLRVSTVTVPPARDLVRIARVSAPREIPPATAIRIEADVASADAAGRTVEIRARSGGVESGFASHRWNAGEVVWTTTLDVVPVGEPPFVVRVEATMAGAAAGGARAARADLVVHRRDSPIGVEFFDPRPSWASTFVRRALESDPRFRVEALTIDTRGFATRTAGARPLADSQLDSFSVVVAGGIERLSAGDVAALERYLRERGGAVVLLPDQRIDSAPLRALLPAFTERLLEQPAILQSPGSTAPLRASEILVAAAPPPAGAVLARVPGNDGAPVVVTLPRGDGRLLVSGAMDAWRYRAVADAAFDRFWQTTIAGLGLATPPPVDVEVAPPIVRHDQPADVVVRVRGEEPLSVTASAGGQP
ncbi:MAG TPA: hypothetical protein VKD69_25135, partial [Vicinamibacterales bacterium]|nr:hypothetical protein [Vicinamibacterales bacterium]